MQRHDSEGIRSGARTTPDPTIRPTSPHLQILVLAYQAETTIAEVLSQVPEVVPGWRTSVVVVDDASSDRTADRARAWADRAGRRDVTVLERPRNLGYGGTQTAAIRAAIDAEVDAVVMVHGDGQHPPELVPDLVRPLLDDEADAVFGSRMLTRGAARRGRMPLVRYLGNRSLSAAQNLLTGAALSEWHSGFRAYGLSVLSDADLDGLTSGFDFDTAITLQLLERGARIVELPVPTHYGDEVSRVDLVRTGARILGQTVRWSLKRRLPPGGTFLQRP